MKDKMKQAVAGIDIALADADATLLQQRGQMWPRHYIECAQALLDARRAVNKLAEIVEREL